MNDQLTDLPDNAPWWAKWLVENWRTIWLEFSTWFMSVIVILAGLPLAVPELQNYLSGRAFHWLMIVCGICGIISKFIKQKGAP